MYTTTLNSKIIMINLIVLGLSHFHEVSMHYYGNSYSRYRYRSRGSSYNRECPFSDAVIVDKRPAVPKTSHNKNEKISAPAVPKSPEIKNEKITYTCPPPAPPCQNCDAMKPMPACETGAMQKCQTLCQFYEIYPSGGCTRCKCSVTIPKRVEVRVQNNPLAMPNAGKNCPNKLAECCKICAKVLIYTTNNCPDCICTKLYTNVKISEANSQTIKTFVQDKHKNCGDHLNICKRMCKQVVQYIENGCLKCYCRNVNTVVRVNAPPIAPPRAPAPARKQVNTLLHGGGGGGVKSFPQGIKPGVKYNAPVPISPINAAKVVAWRNPFAGKPAQPQVFSQPAKPLNPIQPLPNCPINEIEICRQKCEIMKTYVGKGCNKCFCLTYKAKEKLPQVIPSAKIQPPIQNRPNLYSSQLTCPDAIAECQIVCAIMKVYTEKGCTKCFCISYKRKIPIPQTIEPPPPNIITDRKSFQQITQPKACPNNLPECQEKCALMKIYVEQGCKKCFCLTFKHKDNVPSGPNKITFKTINKVCPYNEISRCQKTCAITYFYNADGCSHCFCTKIKPNLTRKDFIILDEYIYQNTVAEASKSSTSTDIRQMGIFNRVDVNRVGVLKSEKIELYCSESENIRLCMNHCLAMKVYEVKGCKRCYCSTPVEEILKETISSETIDQLPKGVLDMAIKPIILSKDVIIENCENMMEDCQKFCAEISEYSDGHCRKCFCTKFKKANQEARYFNITVFQTTKIKNVQNIVNVMNVSKIFCRKECGDQLKQCDQVCQKSSTYIDEYGCERCNCQSVDKRIIQSAKMNASKDYWGIVDTESESGEILDPSFTEEMGSVNRGIRIINMESTEGQWMPLEHIENEEESESDEEQTPNYNIRIGQNNADMFNYDLESSNVSNWKIVQEQYVYDTIYGNDIEAKR